MLPFHLHVQLLTSCARVPTRGTEESGGYDLYSVEDVVIDPFRTVRVRLGIATSFARGWVGLVRDRSSIAWGGGTGGMYTSAGVIDSDYRGEWMVVLTNRSGGVMRVEQGQKIAQVVFVPCANVEPVLVSALEGTERSDGGFGSTGK